MGVPASVRNGWLDGHFTGTMYAALFTVAPNDEGVGGTEVSGNGYARESVTLNAASGGIKTNDGLIQFDTPTGSWGTVVAVCIFSAITGGTFMGVSDNSLGLGEITTGADVEIADDAMELSAA